MTGLSLFGWGHVLTMLGVGVWGAMAQRPQDPLQVRQRVWQAPLTLLGIMGLGTLVGWLGQPLPGADSLTTVFVMAVGLLIALSRGVALVSMVTLVGLYAFFRGMAFVAAWPQSQLPMAVCGLLVATASLHVMGLAMGGVVRRRFLQRRMQVHQAVGSGLTALGVYTLLHTW